MKSQEGYLLIADITGYTMYLSQSELDHAQEILTNLLKLLVDHTRPPLVISRLAGDAVISYGLRGNFFQGQTFIEMIEDTYVAFRKAIELMALNNTCLCNACANVSSLDLKFFVHYGNFGIQRIGDHDELLGNDVNLIHRLLKNQVTEVIGYKAYTLYTGAAIRQLGIDDIGESFVSHSERYEHLGEVQVWVQDMADVWKLKREAFSTKSPPEEVILQVETHIEMPVELVWDYLIQPEFLNTLLSSDRQEITNKQGGRIAPGSVFQCYHGDKFLPLTILEWQPFERIIMQSLVPIPIRETYAIMEYRLVPTESGTQLIQIFSKPSGPLFGRILVKLVLPMTEKQGQKDIEAFKQHIESDLTSKRGGLPVVQLMQEGRIKEAAAASIHIEPGGSAVS